MKRGAMFVPTQPVEQLPTVVLQPAGEAPLGSLARLRQGIGR